MGYNLDKIRYKRSVKYEVLIEALSRGMSIEDVKILADVKNIKASVSTIRNLKKEFVNG